MSGKWMQQTERGTASAIRLIIWIGLSVGRPVARALLYPITLYFLLTASYQRRASRLYLHRVLGCPVTWWHVARHIHAFASTILDRIYLLDDQAQRLDIRLHGVELLQAQVASGRGALLLGSHLGSFEVLRALAVVNLNLPLRILMYRNHNAVITRLLDQINPTVARSVIELGTPDSMIRVSESLAKGCLVGILGDRVAESRKITQCQLLGGTVTLPTAPILLAHRLEVPILLFFGLYRGGNRYDVYFETFAPRVTLDDRRRAEQVQAWMQRFADRIAIHAQDAPYNWFNFYDVWGEMAA
ncbi:MAG TPA: lipid A biosynthesis acyltransferase [bacterium]